MSEKKVDEFIDGMIEEGGCMSDLMDAVTGRVKARICDKYCKYPEGYKRIGDGEVDYEQMLTDVCESCPLNAL